MLPSRLTAPDPDSACHAFESLPAAQRFAKSSPKVILAAGWAWTMLIIEGNAKARKMLEDAAESHLSSARFVSWRRGLRLKLLDILRGLQANDDPILSSMEG